MMRALTPEELPLFDDPVALRMNRMEVEQFETRGRRDLTDEEKEQFPGYRYVTRGETFVLLRDGRSMRVPGGVVMDGSSGGPDWGASWLVHDYCYAMQRWDDEQEMTRREADDLMEAILRFEGQRFYAWCVHVVFRWNCFYIPERSWRGAPERLQRIEDWDH